MKACSECKKEIGTDAAACPKCNGTSTLTKIGGVIVGGFTMMMVCAGFASSSTSKSEQQGWFHGSVDRFTIISLTAPEAMARGR